MELKKLHRKFTKKLHAERDRLMNELEKVDNLIGALDGARPERKRRRRKMTAAHRRAISRGMRARKAKENEK